MTILEMILTVALIVAIQFACVVLYILRRDLRADRVLTELQNEDLDRLKDRLHRVREELTASLNNATEKNRSLGETLVKKEQELSDAHKNIQMLLESPELNPLGSEIKV